MPPENTDSQKSAQAPFARARAAASRALDVTADRLRLRDNGWPCVPVWRRRKKPAISSWQLLGDKPPTEADIEAWGEALPSATSTGLVAGRGLVFFDLDVLDVALVAQVRACAFAHCGLTPFRRVGLAPKLALIYRVAEGERVEICRYPTTDGSGHQIEILGHGAQIVAFGDHPDTHKPYLWVGEETPLVGGGPVSSPSENGGQSPEDRRAHAGPATNRVLARSARCHHAHALHSA